MVERKSQIGIYAIVTRKRFYFPLEFLWKWLPFSTQVSTQSRTVDNSETYFWNERKDKKGILVFNWFLTKRIIQKDKVL